MVLRLLDLIPENISKNGYYWGLEKSFANCDPTVFQLPHFSLIEQLLPFPHPLQIQKIHSVSAKATYGIWVKA